MNAGVTCFPKMLLDCMYFIALCCAGQRSEEDTPGFGARMERSAGGRNQPGISLPPPQQEPFRQWSGADWRTASSRQVGWLQMHHNTLVMREC